MSTLPMQCLKLQFTLCRKLRKVATDNMHSNVDKANFSRHLYPAFFIVSSRVIYSHIARKKLQPGWSDMDEEGLFNWMYNHAKIRITKKQVLDERKAPTPHMCTQLSFRA